MIPCDLAIMLSAMWIIYTILDDVRNGISRVRCSSEYSPELGKVGIFGSIGLDVQYPY